MYFQKLVAIKCSGDIWAEEKEIQEEVYKEVKKLCCCGAIMAMLIVLYVCTYSDKEQDINNGVIEKEVSETQRILTYETENGTVQGSTKITIPEMPYSEQEAQKLFAEVTKVLEQKILGDNISLENVCKDLNFIENIEDNPVEIQWSTDNEEVINSEGEVFCAGDTFPEGGIVMVTAELSVGEHQQEYRFPVRVTMPEEKDIIWWQRAVERKLKNIVEQGKEEKVVSLPKNIEGYAISFQEQQNKRPWYYLLAIPVITGMLFYGNRQEAEKQREKRKKGMLRDYPEILSRFSLYVQAGMTGKKALERLVHEYETQNNQVKKGDRKNVRYGYEELRRTYYEMKGGVSEHEAYKNMGERTGLSEYKQFSTIMIQQLEKGTKGFLHMLQQETGEAFEQRKRLAKEAGEEAGTKMLLPMGILFVITLALIMIPPCLSFIF